MITPSQPPLAVTNGGPSRECGRVSRWGCIVLLVAFCFALRAVCGSGGSCVWAWAWLGVDRFFWGQAGEIAVGVSRASASLGSYRGQSVISRGQTNEVRLFLDTTQHQGSDMVVML